MKNEDPPKNAHGINFVSVPTPMGIFNMTTTSEYFRALQAKRKRRAPGTGRRKLMRQCPLCREQHGAREMRKHLREAHNTHWSKVQILAPK